MHSIEKQYRLGRMSLRSHLGSALATVAVFAAIASTSLHRGPVDTAQPKERPVYYLAPPRDLAEARSVSQKAPDTIDTFAVDTVPDAQSETLAFAPIDVSIDSDIAANITLDLEMDRAFHAAAPETSPFELFTIFERSEVDEIPVLRYAREPAVPQLLRGKTVEVIVFYYVNAKGRTENQSVLDSTAPEPIYGELAVEAIKDWRFKPARKNKQPVACWVQQTIRFNQGSTSPFSI